MGAACVRKGLLLFVVLLLNCERSDANLGHVVPVEKQDLVREVEVEGTLRSLESDPVGPPALINARNFKIIRMSPEGTVVKAGDEVIAFDPTDLETKIDDRESEIENRAEEIGKLRAENALTALTDKQTLEETGVERGKAERKAEKPADLTAGLDLKIALIDRDLLRRSVSSLQEREKAKRMHEGAAVAILEARLQRARGKLAELQSDIAAMSVKARRAGTVIYRQNWRGEKLKIGDSAYQGRAVLEIASLEQMAAQGQVSEVDASHVTVGQRVGLRLDSHLEKEYSGTVERVATLVQTASLDSQRKVVQLDIKLAATDPLFMRPNMRFRGRIEIERVPQVVQIPIAAIRSTASGPVVSKLETGGAMHVISVKLGRRSREMVEVASGLQPGDQVLLPTRSGESAGSDKSAVGRGTS